MALDIVTVGPLNVDLLITGQAPVVIEDLVRWAGPSNVMLAAAGSAGYVTQDLAHFGLRTGIVSVLADDPFGDAVFRLMSEAGVEMVHVARAAGTLSGIGIYMLLFGSKKRPLTYRLPTHSPWPRPFTQGNVDYVLRARHVHSAGYLHFPEMWSQDMANLFRAARRRGLTTSVDPQFVLFPVETPWLAPLVDLLTVTDLLMLDEDEARRISEMDELAAAARVLQQAGPATVVIKRGERGALVRAGDRWFEQPAEPVPESEIVESIGAGDAFDAGLLSGFLEGWPIERSVRFATLAAASTLRGAGGTETLAMRGELLARMAGDAAGS